jgi:hypothetical protein
LPGTYFQPILKLLSNQPFHVSSTGVDWGTWKLSIAVAPLGGATAHSKSSDFKGNTRGFPLLQLA